MPPFFTVFLLVYSKTMNFTKGIEKIYFGFTKEISLTNPLSGAPAARLFPPSHLFPLHFTPRTSTWRACGAPSAPLLLFWCACGALFPSIFLFGPASSNNDSWGCIFQKNPKVYIFKKFFKPRSS